MSQYEFKLPDIGEGVTEGEIVGWLIQEGDSVTENQDMVEIMTDKATVTIGAPKTGKVVSLRGKTGDVVPVGQTLVVLDVDGGAPNETSQAPVREASAPQAAPAKAPEGKQEKQAEPARKGQPPAERSEEVARSEQSAARGQQEKSSDEGPVASAVGDLREALPGMQREQRGEAREAKAGNGYQADRPLAAPATRRLARELGVDLRRVEPSGPSGRVTREDVERFRDRSSGGGAPSPASAEKASAESAPQQQAPAARPARPPAQGEEERLPIRGLRKRIFENMARSKHTAAHFTYVDECDATGLKKLRKRLLPHAEQAGVKLSFLPFIVKAAIVALKKHRALNCLVDDQTGEMVLRNTFDIGIAVAADAGLMVAALRDADRLSFVEMAREIDRLATAARENKLRKEDIGQTSFTITSLGKLGGLFATPIVNYPEVAILGVHEIKRRPVVQGDQIVVGEVMLLSLSFDHRIIDGHVGAAFAQEIIGLLEEPDRLLIEA